MKKVNLTDEQKAIWKEWAVRLRSGKYRQGRGRLQTLDAVETSYCCLGVLCDIYADPKLLPTGMEAAWEVYLTGVGRFKVREVDTDDWSWQTGSLPFPVREWSGADDAAAEYFASANDYWRLSFDQIADLIDHAVDKGEFPTRQAEAEAILGDR